MPQPVVIFWFRRDLRLHDNAGLRAALRSGHPVVPLFIFDRYILDGLEDRDDRRVSFIHAAIEKLQQQLIGMGSTLDVRYGHPEAVFSELMGEYTVAAVYTNDDYEPYAVRRDSAVQKSIHPRPLHRLKDSVIFEKGEIVKPDGTHYRMYAPYARRWQAALGGKAPALHRTDDLHAAFFRQAPLPVPSLPSMGFTRVDTVLIPEVPEGVIRTYEATRDLPALQGTTRLGVHLRFGTVSIREVVARAVQWNQKFLQELIWRDFFTQLLYHQPELERACCKREYEGVRYRNSEADFEKWREGRTGYPLVDAGMRELEATGFMHNRVRMVTASFLVKHLLVDWRWGEAYFARRLMDYELASNNGNWQWVAGCGCDAAPWFRVFNPAAQEKKFDPERAYIRKWVPEVDTAAYPAPMIAHTVARDRCLSTYKEGLSREGGR